MTHPSTVADTLDAGDGWLEWSSGECPVPGATRVAVRFRDGGADWSTPAGFWADGGNVFNMWKHTGGSSDIIAYRVVQP